MDSNEIIAMFDECTLPISKARSLLSLLAVALHDRDKLWSEDAISSVEVIRGLIDEGLKGLDCGFNQLGDAPAVAAARASSLSEAKTIGVSNNV
ncbi:hypothetical protein [Symbiopectobacterium purcellii]|uniref:hypothetical protein n=1 Tax=Symbiopectobacterium purcellii TaxID=2871826 RepID=UPI003F8242E2